MNFVVSLVHLLWIKGSPIKQYPKLKSCFYIKSQPLGKKPNFCLSAGMGLGVLTRALSPSIPAIFPNSQSADSASRSWVGMANSQCCQCHTCCPDCATCLFCVCLPLKGWWPSLPWGKAAQLPWAKQTPGYRSQWRERP